MINRSIPPILHEIETFKVPKLNEYSLDNGLKVFELNAGTQEIVKMELVMNGGRWFEEKALVSRCTASLLKEETKNLDAKALAEKIDFYGASIFSHSTMDVSSLGLMCLTKHFSQLMPILKDIWIQPKFTETELSKFIERSILQMQIDLSKNDVVAYREITERIFGEKHPYGYNSNAEMYREVQISDLNNHHQVNYFKKDSVIILSGLINEKIRKGLNQAFGQQELRDGFNKDHSLNSLHIKGTIKKKSQQDLQTAIRIGKPLFTRNHKDYNLFYLLNTILGGYFGSRLMKNLREEKGLTYGIYSYAEAMVNNGYFSISTEVGNAQYEMAIDEIYRELDRIKSELIGDEEMKMAKNYIIGQFLGMMDGPLKISQLLKTMIFSNKDLNFLYKMIEEIKGANAYDIRELARTHLDALDFSSVYVGDI